MGRRAGRGAGGAEYFFRLTATNNLGLTSAPSAPLGYWAGVTAPLAPTTLAVAPYADLGNNYSVALTWTIEAAGAATGGSPLTGYALQYALGANKLFNLDESSEYVETIITKCIDQYTKLQVDNFQAAAAAGDNTTTTTTTPIDPRLEDIVNRMFQRCFDEKKFKQAIGIAIETRRLDVFEKAILTSVRANFDCVFEMK